MNRYVFSFQEIDKHGLGSVGGKGANLGELCRIPGIKVPEGFCVTTKAYRDFVNTSREFASLLKSLEIIDAEAKEEIMATGERIRTHLESLDIPAPVRQEITAAWRKTGPHHAYAIRSSATAEDLPGASFAGQHDTFLNVRGERDILACVRKCWASLFTDRAIVYRQKNGIPHGRVFMAVVVQRMVFPEVSGIMFTADPVTGNRKIVSIDDSFGLGEALVAGIVSADLYQVRAGRVIKKQIARKETTIYARPGGGTVKAEVTEEKQTAPALSDGQAVRLARMGQSIAEHFGSPQDIEWCLAGNEIFIVQSRPVTTLYPVPGVIDDKLHLFLSFGHPQMMTDAMKPLGISVLRTLVPFGKSAPQAESELLRKAGSRLYLDITLALAYREAGKLLPGMLLNIDEAMGRAVLEFLGREDFRAAAQPGKKMNFALVKKVLPTAFAVLKNILFRDNYRATSEINRFIAEKVEENKTRLPEVSGAERIGRIQEVLS
ncbi:MAG: PEP/pyruvate-binding domain-containing protein, partial [Desulfotomaculales bacterium]